MKMERSGKKLLTELGGIGKVNTVLTDFPL